jgi:hypothetical protein
MYRLHNRRIAGETRERETQMARTMHFRQIDYTALPHHVAQADVLWFVRGIRRDRAAGVRQADILAAFGPHNETAVHAALNWLVDSGRVAVTRTAMRTRGARRGYRYQAANI